MFTTRNGLLNLFRKTSERMERYGYRPTLSYPFAASGSAGAVGPALTFTRASAQTGFSSAGVMSSYASDVPVYDYNPTTLAPLGLSLWEARTNLFLNSALDGTALATQGVTTTAQAYTVSFYGTGSITFSGAFVGSLNGTGATDRVTTTFTPAAGTVTCTVSGSVKWANFEAGSFATPFIVTAGASATRASFACTTADLSWFNASEGTFVSSETRYATAIADGTVFQIDDGTANNRIANGTGATGAVLNPFVVTGGVAQAVLTQAASTGTGNSKLALAYKANDFAASANGAAAVTDAAGTIPSGLTTLRIGQIAGPVSFYNGWVSSLAYYPIRLPNASIQGLATI